MNGSFHFLTEKDLFTRDRALFRNRVEQEHAVTGLFADYGYLSVKLLKDDVKIGKSCIIK